jgi:peptide-methionine (S)-S-oxide reductase
MANLIKAGLAGIVVSALLSMLAGGWNSFAFGSGAVRPGVDYAASAPKGKQRVVLAGGCFWGMEAVFESLKGVSNVVSGYAGGSASTAHYEIVSTGLTGHAEAIEVTYDPAQITFEQLLNIDFTVAHDPTQVDRQGPDVGRQYRSAIFYTTPAQAQAAQRYIEKLTAAKMFRDRIATEIVPLKAFYAAEAYHQHFVEHNPNYPYVVYNDLPKLQQLRARFPALVKSAKR